MESTKKAAPGRKPNSSGKSSKNNQKKKKKSFTNILKIFLIAMIVIGFVGAGGVYAYVTLALKDIEPIDPDMIAAKLTENSVIVDGEGRILEYIHQKEGLRKVIRYEDMSEDLINAFVAVEDKTFFEHNGFNIVRLFGAVKDTLTTGKRLGGTSTITQQLARNIYLFEVRSKRDIDRKIKEAYYAIELEKYLKKEQIIEGYLNLVYLGANSNGVEAASQAYFSKTAAELDYIESALLAGIVKSPSLYPPMLNIPKVEVTEEHYVFDDSDPLYTLVYNPRCEDRYLTSIYLMHQNEKITDAEYEYAKTVDLRTVLNPGKTAQAEISSFFADMVRDEVIEDLVEAYGYSVADATNLLYTGGFTIESTIDFDMQKTLESHYAQTNFTTYFGESTAVAVRAFQRDNGLAVDGVAGQNTLAKIKELTGMDTSIFTQSVYQRGNNSEEVVLLKKTLFELGYLINNENFPKVTVMLDGQGNIISEESRRLLVYKQSNLIDSDGNFIIPTSDYKFDDEGNLVLLKGKRMYFYPHYQNDQLVSIQLVVKETFTFSDDQDNEKLAGGKFNLTNLYTYAGSDVLVPNDYKSFDADSNVVIDKAFLSENPDFFKVDGNQNLLVTKGNFVISEKGVIQPQSAMVIIDYHNGELKSIVGGRDISGQRMYNRATNPRQPGSAIKPLSVFTPAIDSGRYTAATVTDDRPVYLLGDPKVRWPLNWYEAYPQFNKHWGLVTLRESVQHSINVTAALIVQDLGVPTSIDYLNKFGISTLVTSGPTNDQNIAAVALGGMTRGITPLDLTAAYGAIANKGVLNDVITYKTVKNSRGEIVLQNESKQKYIVDENVAYIVQDMMRTSVESGVATPAKLSPNNDIIPVSGKTGTTSSNIDAWFIGYTPYYVGGVWFGNDFNFPLDQGSRIAAQFWKTVMADIHVDKEPMAFDVPTGIVTTTVDIISGKLPSELSALDPRGTVRSEIFLRGTEPTETDDVHVMADVCTESNKLATEFCPTTLVTSKLFVKRPEPYNPADHNNIVIRDGAYDLPIEECDIHTAENTTEEQTTGSQYQGVVPLVKLADGSYYVQRRYPIELTSGQTIVLPVGSKILPDNSVVFSDGSSISSENIKSIPMYTAEELDALNP